MEKSEKIFRLEGSVQHYDWGGKTFLPELLHLENSAGKPYAEFWMGAHLKSPSQIIFRDGRKQPLHELISADPQYWLGKAVSTNFGSLPYLLKAQDVKHMLSIQVHPSKQEAEKKFLEENERGISLDAGNRNYKDKNHKPELLSPLSDFYLLHGFKSPDKLRAILENTPELNFLVEYFGRDNYQKIYTHLMRMPQAEVNLRLEPLLQRIAPLYEAGKLSKDAEDFWAARAAGTFGSEDNRDRGIFSIYLFNVVKMNPGQALFQDAGLPHAYLEGHTMEIMANSDNVLRGGLTPKHIDVDELLEHVIFHPTVPAVIPARPVINSAEVFKTPAKDFELSKIALDPGGRIQWTSTGPEILFIYHGSTAVAQEAESLNANSGQAVFVAPGAKASLSSLVPSIIFRASVPGD